MVLSAVDQARVNNYGATTEDLTHFHSQKSCAICDRPFGSTVRKNFDHSHSGGFYRGTLCSACNGALGSFKDDTRLLQRAIQYLEAHSSREEHAATVRTQEREAERQRQYQEDLRCRRFPRYSSRGG